MTSSQTRSMMAEKNAKCINSNFSHFKSIICYCGLDNFKSFSCILLKFVWHVTNKEYRNVRFTVIFHILRHLLDLVVAIT